MFGYFVHSRVLNVINAMCKILGEQYRWLGEDLMKVDRSVTPWVIATTHPPWYNSYRSHYREAECMRQSMEDLLYIHGVDVMLHGHVRTTETFLTPHYIILVSPTEKLNTT